MLDNNALLDLARETLKYSYSPYSNFRVGSALLASSGKVYLGCNIENASYGASICSERVAIVKAISEGEKNFEAIAIVSSSGEFTYPCGECRQFISEFALNLKILVQQNSEIRQHRLHELLPSAFITFNSSPVQP